jgi:hypothetical protein
MPSDRSLTVHGEIIQDCVENIHQRVPESAGKDDDVVNEDAFLRQTVCNLAIDHNRLGIRQ